MSTVPEKLVNFRVYLDGNTLLGTADVTLPSIESVSDTVKGAGIAGEVDAPTIGHFGAMSLTINWRLATGDLTELLKQQAHHLDIRGVGQAYDAGAGAYVQVPQKLVVKAIPKKVELGKFDMGSGQDSSWEGEVVYLKFSIDGKDKVEIDKYNFICVINGEDMLAEVRSGLGMG